MDINGNSGEGSDENEEYIIGNWRKGDPCYKPAKSLVKLCSSVLWKVELASCDTRYLAEEILKQSVEKRLDSVLLNAYRKRQNRPEED